MTDELKPAASIVPSHCSGSAFAFDPGVLHVNKDGSGYVAIDEDDFVCEDDCCEGEHGPEGSIHWIAQLDASEMTALRDFLNGVTSSALDALRTENERLRKALEFYENPAIYKPHPHGPAFDNRDLSFHARAELERMP